MLHIKYLLLAGFIATGIRLHSQTDSTRFYFGANADLYYGYDFSNPSTHERPGFIYNHKRHNEVNANLILLKGGYAAAKSRAKLGIMAGTYAQYNLASEPAWVQYIYEANAGILLSGKHKLWLDAGIMPSHIGFESAISSECWTLTRSMLAEQSPYYEAGMRLNYTNSNEKLSMNLLYLNGWQKVRRPAGMQQPSFGIQITYTPYSGTIFNYSNFIGSNKPDSVQALRIYHNLYAQLKLSERISFIAGFDIGTESVSDSTATWYSPVIIGRYIFSKTFTAACRAEYYSDRQQAIIQTNTLNGFRTAGFSVNFDYRVSANAVLRLEGKMYHSMDPVFERYGRNNYAVTSSIGMTF